MECNQEEVVLSFADLSEEILFKIFSNFEPKDLFSVCRTCKQFSSVGSDNTLWENHFLDRYRKKEPYIFDVLDEFSKESKVEFEENQKKVSLVNYKKLMVEKLPIEKNWRKGLHRITNVTDELLQEVEVFQFDIVNGSRVMVTAHQDGHVRIWSIVTMKGNMEFKLMHELKSLHPGLIWWLEVKQGIAVTAGQEGGVNIIDVVNGTFKTMEKKFLRSIWCVDVVPSMDLVIGGGDDGYVYFWKMSTGKQTKRVPLDAPIYDVNAFPTRKEVYVAAEEGHISILNIETAEIIGQLELPLQDQTLIYMKKEDEKTLVCSSLEGMVFIWDVENKIVVDTFKSGGAGWSVSLFENFLCVGVSERGGRSRGIDMPTAIRIWDYKTKEQLHDISVPTKSYLRRISCIKSTNEQIIYSSGGLFILDFS